MITRRFYTFFFCAFLCPSLLGMSLEQKIGQLFCVGVPLNILDKPDEFRDMCALLNKYNIGAILLNGGNVMVGGRDTIKQQCDLVNALTQVCAQELVYFQDFEWGPAMRLADAPKFPFALTCGAIQDDALIERMGEEIGRQCVFLKVCGNFAPVADVNSNPRNPVIGRRSFGADKYNVARKAVAYIEGLKKRHVLGFGKHALGHGATGVDSHLGLPVSDKSIAELEEMELYPFKCAIEAGVPGIMTAHILFRAYDEHWPATLSPAIITGVLREKLSFRGLIITDALRMKGLTIHFDTATIAEQAFRAGNDMLLYAVDANCSVYPLLADVAIAIGALVDAYKAGRISETEIDERLARIAAARQWASLEPRPCHLDADLISQQLHNPRVLALKKELYQSAMTVVRDEHGAVPVLPDTHAAIVEIGHADAQLSTIFAEVVCKNMPHAAAFNIPARPKDTDLELLCTQLAPYPVVIIGLFEINRFDFEHFGVSPDVTNLIQRLSACGKQVIVSVFGIPYSLKILPRNIPAIMAYEEDPDAQEAAALVVVGKLEPKGWLPIADETAVA